MALEHARRADVDAMLLQRGEVGVGWRMHGFSMVASTTAETMQSGLHLDSIATCPFSLLSAI